MFEMIAYLIGGALSGLLAGLLGIGGGLVTIPFLAFALPLVGFSPTETMHVAVTTSLANIVVTSIVSMYSHHKRQGVRWDIIGRFFPACILGAIAGALLANYLSGVVLSTIFGLFTFFIVYTLLKPRADNTNTRTLPTGWKLNSSIFSISGFCSLLGMGGGSLMVPYLNFYNIPLRNAVGTSAACGFFIAVSGLGCLMCSNLHLVSPRPEMTGYLYWPAFICMSSASVLCAPQGAKMAHHLPVDLLRKIFAGFLVIVGCSMLFKAFE